VNIVNDTSTMSTAVTSLVKDYNAVVTALNTQEGKSSTGTAEPFFGNPLIATIQEQMDTAISGSSSGDANGMAAIGVTIKTDGTLTLNTDTLSTALSTNFNTVLSLFQGAGGVGENLTTAVNSLGNNQPTGILQLAANENTSQETDLNSTLTRMNANITSQTATLTAQLNAANQTLQLIPVQIQEVNVLYDAVTGYGQSK
jgi:flagellar hook-associated protein 2